MYALKTSFNKLNDTLSKDAMESADLAVETVERPELETETM